MEVLIEIPAGSPIKYEVDEESGQLKVDRFLHTAFVYPFNYGYAVGTNGDDDDPVDVIVLSTHSVHPGVTIECNAVGILDTEDEAGGDAKIIAVPTEKIDPHYGTFKDIGDVPESILNQIKHFFENYKTLEPGKWVKVKDYKGAKEAKAVIKKAS